MHLVKSSAVNDELGWKLLESIMRGALALDVVTSLVGSQSHELSALRKKVIQTIINAREV